MKKLIIILLFLLPVVAQSADYGFGGDTINAVNGAGNSDSMYWFDSISTPANGGNLDSVVVWLSDGGVGTDSVNIVIYNNDSTFLDSTAGFILSGNSRVRYAAQFIIGASLAASTKYLVVIHWSSTGNGGGGSFYYYSAGSVIPSWYKTAQGVVPATITAPTKNSNNRAKAIWVFFSDAAASSSKKMGATKIGAAKL